MSNESFYEWRPVSELPDMFYRQLYCFTISPIVLVWYRCGGFGAGFCILRDGDSQEEWRSGCSNGFDITDKITHWKYGPDAPIVEASVL